MIDELLKLKHCKPQIDINYTSIPCSQVDMTDDGMVYFNNIVSYIESRCLKKIKRTPSGGISNEGSEKYYQRYDLRSLNSMIELTIVMEDGCWRIQFRNSFERMGSEMGISGKCAFWNFSNLCKKYKINLESYRIRDVEVAKEHKLNTEAYLKTVLSPVYLDKEIENVHHIDLNSSFMSHLCKSFNEFYPVGEYLYNSRKDNPINKGVMNNVIGYFGSNYINYGFAHLRRAAVNGNNESVRNLIEELRNNERIPILINTDGIWYSGDEYHPNNGSEGLGFGQWKHDHTNCLMLIKSPACYQFKESGVIKTVMSGRCKLDNIKSRENWSWGEIYNDDIKLKCYTLKNNRIVAMEVMDE